MRARPTRSRRRKQRLDRECNSQNDLRSIWDDVVCDYDVQNRAKWTEGQAHKTHRRWRQSANNVFKNIYSDVWECTILKYTCCGWAISWPVSAASSPPPRASRSLIKWYDPLLTGQQRSSINQSINLSPTSYTIKPSVVYCLVCFLRSCRDALS